MEFSTLMEAVFSSGPATLSIFILLLIMSLLTTAVIIAKAIQYRKEVKKDAVFLKGFQEADSFKSYFDETSQAKSIFGLSAIFQAVYKEITLFENQVPDLNFADEGMKVFKSNVEEAIDRSLDEAKMHENGRRERGIGILATSSNVAPFVGLLGTVIGIINAFGEIGKAGSADLAFVAPAISEALVATALGLLVAIPASIAFNYFKNKSQSIREVYDGFGLSLQNKIQQYYLFKKG